MTYYYTISIFKALLKWLHSWRKLSNRNWFQIPVQAHLHMPALVHLNGCRQVFRRFLWFDRFETSTSGAESSKRTQRDESSRHNIWNYLCFKFIFFKNTL